ncbi:MAG: MBL fold metallo-hydrolase [Dehalococcoidia bacterium]
MQTGIPLTFLGTGNFFAPGHYWNSFLLGNRILFEPSPAILPNLNKCGIDRTAIDVIFLSHFHCDHSFGWPFLLLDYLVNRRQSDLWVVGPPGVEQFLNEMLYAGRIDHIVRLVQSEVGSFPLHYVEVDEQEQEAGPVRFRATRVEHDATLECFGFVVEHEGRQIGYSGDTQLCDGLRTIAARSEALVLEASARKGITGGHIDLSGVRQLRSEFPHVPFILTHVGKDIDSDGIAKVRVAQDLESVDV